MVRFGVIATGTIAHKFASTAPLVDEMELAAVASRTIEKAQAFADEFGIPTAYGSYEELFADPDIDAVYIATPHPFHKPCALAAIAAGKHVLCEKPLTLTRADSAEVYEAARERGVFLMEAMWTRFIPTILAAKDWIREGRIGEVRLVQAAFGYNTKYFKSDDMIYNKALDGGALFDVGVYCIEASLDFLEGHAVTDVSGFARLTPSGVDAVNAFLLRFDNGALANLSSAVMCDQENDGVICGEKGRIRLYPKFYAPEYAELVVDEQVVEKVRCEFTSGFEFEIRHMIEKIEAGAITSDRIQPADTLACAEIFDKLMADGFVGK
ncbi:MAG: Gfo/Idh/MocA family oxidoreductase [Clostridia bacterium]|nr:Gfo/Idh/MocA family oxidoreductase [Clostridia bacterium]